MCSRSPRGYFRAAGIDLCDCPVPGRSIDAAFWWPPGGPPGGPIRGGPEGKFKKHLEDTDHRLAILFDHLNNEELLTPDTIQEMNELADFVQNKQFDEAMATCTDLITNKTDQGTDWMTGVKRLIQFGKNTPGAR